jgi:outer membrane phospholipase A
MILGTKRNLNLLTTWCAAVIVLSISAAGVSCADANQSLGRSDVAGKKQSFFEHFHGHEPVYLLYGWDPDNIKFQISFKYRLLNPDGSLAKKRPRLADFYFGYTQTSFIDLESPSDAFLDNNFKPELLFSQKNLVSQPFAWLSQLGLEAGIQHQSNGDSGADSRSLNLLYTKPILTFGDTGTYHLTAAPKIWVYVGSLRENPDIADYWGHFDLELKIGKTDGLELRSDWRQGSGGGSLQIDLTVPLGVLCFGNCNGYVQLQYFSGYGETLLNYNRKDRQLRIGFAFFR